MCVTALGVSVGLGIVKETDTDWPSVQLKPGLAHLARVFAALKLALEKERTVVPMVSLPFVRIALGRAESTSKSIRCKAGLERDTRIRLTTSKVVPP